MTLRETMKKGGRGLDHNNINTRRVPLVAYSDSESFSSDDDNGRVTPSTPVTPFFGKRGHVNKS